MSDSETRLPIGKIVKREFPVLPRWSNTYAWPGYDHFGDKLEDVALPEHTVDPGPAFKLNVGSRMIGDGGFEVFTESAGMVSKFIVDTTEAETRRRLIELGWTPPLESSQTCEKVEPWKPVVYAHECSPCVECGEPVCPFCGIHYADCSCPGPTQDDLEYRSFNGVEFARKREIADAL